jgi:hypothetical protein
MKMLKKICLSLLKKFAKHIKSFQNELKEITYI